MTLYPNLDGLLLCLKVKRIVTPSCQLTKKQRRLENVVRQTLADFRITHDLGRQHHVHAMRGFLLTQKLSERRTSFAFVVT